MSGTVRFLPTALENCAPALTPKPRHDRQRCLIRHLRITRVCRRRRNRIDVGLYFFVLLVEAAFSSG